MRAKAGCDVRVEANQYHAMDGPGAEPHVRIRGDHGLWACAADAGHVCTPCGTDGYMASEIAALGGQGAGFGTAGGTRGLEKATHVDVMRRCGEVRLHRLKVNKREADMLPTTQ